MQTARTPHDDQPAEEPDRTVTRREIEMQRVLIIGPCGSGKSTLSRIVGDQLGLPVYHMDQLGWLPGWIETEKEMLRERIEAVVATDRWVIEGNYGSTLHMRLPRADTVIYLDFPIRLCLWRLLRRTLNHRGHTRPDMTEGCPERFDFAFFRYVLFWNWGPGPRTEKHLCGHEGKVTRLRGPGALNGWLAALRA